MNDDATLTPAEPTATPPPSRLHEIFIGKDGLRAGWSLLIFVALLVAFIICARGIVHLFHPSAPKTARAASEIIPAPSLFISEALAFLVTFFVTWIMSKIERRPNSVYGLGDRHRLPHFFAGLAWGVSFLSLLVLILWKTGLLVIDSRLLWGRDIVRYGAVWLLSFVLVGLFEEYLTRGYLQYTLTRGLAGLCQWAFKTRHSAAIGFWTSAAILSILFGLAHSSNPGESPIGLLGAGLVSMVFCLSLWRSGSLWWAIGFHASWDWAQSFLYGVANSGAMVQHHLLATHPVGKPILSGGATGPEGSLFVVAILALTTLVILYTLPRAHYGLPEREEHHEPRV